MFSLFPVVLEGLVGLLPSLSAPVQGQRGLHLQHPSLIVWQGPKLLPGYFLKTPLTETLLQLNLAAEPRKAPGGRRKVPGSTKSIGCSLSPVRHWWGVPWPWFGGTGLECGSR